MKDPTTLPEDIYGLLDEDSDHTVSEENVAWAADVFKEILRTRLSKRQKKTGEDVLRFSNLGKPDRQIWYEANDSEGAEKLSGKTKFKFLYGDLIEVLVLFLAKESGHEVTDCQLEVSEDGVTGHIDAKIDGVLTDVKSCSAYSYEKFKSGNYLFDDPFGYVAQLSGYAHKTNAQRAGYLPIDKVNGGISFVELPEEYIRGNDPARRIKELREVIRSPNPPARCYPDQAEGKSGNRKLGIGCSYCPFKDKCWADANGGRGLRKFMYSRGPVWLTHVAKEPKVDEVDT